MMYDLKGNGMTALDGIKGMLENALDDIFFEYQSQNGIDSGDIHPWKAIQLDGMLEELADFIIGIYSGECPECNE